MTRTLVDDDVGHQLRQPAALRRCVRRREDREQRIEPALRGGAGERVQRGVVTEHLAAGLDVVAVLDIGERREDRRHLRGLDRIAARRGHDHLAADLGHPSASPVDGVPQIVERAVLVQARDQVGDALGELRV